MPRIYGQPGEAGAAGSPGPVWEGLGLGQEPTLRSAGCAFDPHPAGQGFASAELRSGALLRFGVRDLE